MFHGDNDFSAAANQVHGTAHTLDHLSWNDPVGKVTFARDLEASEDADVHGSSTDHCEGLIRAEVASSSCESHSLLSCIDQVCINLILSGEAVQAKDTILALEGDLYTWVKEV